MIAGIIAKKKALEEQKNPALEVSKKNPIVVGKEKKEKKCTCSNL